MKACKFFYMLALAMVAVAAPAADGITLSARARPVSEVLEEVERQTGVKLDAAASLRGLPLFIEVKDMPAKAFFERLLKITDAEWDRRDDTLVLSRGSHKMKLALEAETRDRTPRVAEAIRRYLDANKGREDWSDNTVQDRVKRDLETRQNLQNQLGGRAGQIMTVSSNGDSPAIGVLHEALRRIPAATFASVLPGEKLVLSSSANRLQKALPYNPAKSIEQYIAVQNKIAAALEAAGGASRDTRISTDLSNGQSVQRIAELIITIQRQPEGEGLSIVGYLVDPRGEIAAQPRAWISPTPVGAGTAPVGTDYAITLSPDSVALLQLLKLPAAAQNTAARMVGANVFISIGDGTASLGGGEVQRPIPSEELAKKLAEPTKFDPLSFVVSDVMSGLADKTGRQLMATVPDSMLGYIAQGLSGNTVNLKALWTQQMLGLVATTDEHGWLIHPRLFAEAERQRVDRAALERLIASPNRLGDTARYATVMSQSWNMFAIDYQWTKLMAYTAHMQLRDGSKRPYLKLFGNLPENSRKPPAGRNANFVINQLPTVPRLIAERIILQSGGTMLFGDGMMTMALDMGGQNRNAIPAIMAAEATEAFPDGIDGRARLEIGLQADEALYAINAQGQGEFLNATELGFRLGIPPGTPGLPSPPSYKEFEVADVERITMSIFIARSVRSQSTLDDWSLRKPATKYSLDTLPPKLKAQIEESKKMAGNINIGGLRGGPPPNRPPQP